MGYILTLRKPLMRVFGLTVLNDHAKSVFPLEEERRVEPEQSVNGMKFRFSRTVQHKNGRHLHPLRSRR